MPITDDLIIQLLKEGQVANDDVIAQAKTFAAQSNITLQESLEQQEIITDENLGLMVANHLQVPFVVLTKTTIPEEVLRIIPDEVALRQGALAFARDENGVKVALTDIENKTILEMVAKKTGQTVSVFFVTKKDFDNAIALYKKELQKTFEKLLKEGLGSATNGAGVDDPPIEKIVDLLVDSAYEQKASDIHVEAREKITIVRFRVDGVLHDVLTVPKILHDRIITRIKILSSLRTDEHLSAQDGKMQKKIADEMLDLRVSIIPIADGEKVVLRLLSSKSRSFTLSELGMNERDLAKVTKAFGKSYGMILSTGPTGSGKTTSIYAILKVLNKRGINITSIEDPVEYKIEGANQIQVNAKTNLTFANGLRSILRQDPNYIFVGEIRDNETAGIAVNAALTGHLVLSTLHTNDSAGAIPRLIDMKVEPFLAASTVLVIIAQRLVRKICDHCRVSQSITSAELTEHLGIDEPSIQRHIIPQGKNKEIRIYQGKGCSQCHFTGYQGRLGVFEVLEVTQKIKELVTQKKDADEIHRAAIEDGMTSMVDDGLEKISKGMTTLEEIIRVTKIEMT